MHYAVADYMLDIVENAIDAGSAVITVDLIDDGEFIKVCIGDNGPGMSEETLKKVRDPFYTDGKKHKSRKVGLGIPFVEQAAQTSGGEFDLRSEEGLGSSVYFTFKKDHIDCPPLGDIPGTVVSMMMFGKEYELVFTNSTTDGRFVVLRSELIDALGSLNDAESLILAKRYIAEHGIHTAEDKGESKWRN